jgi:hypothetical protein
VKFQADEVALEQIIFPVVSVFPLLINKLPPLHAHFPQTPDDCDSSERPAYWKIPGQELG